MASFHLLVAVLVGVLLALGAAGAAGASGSGALSGLARLAREAGGLLSRERAVLLGARLSAMLLSAAAMLLSARLAVLRRALLARHARHATSSNAVLLGLHDMSTETYEMRRIVGRLVQQQYT